MRLIKLSEDHYVLTDDSEIRIGDIVAEKLLTGEYELFTIHTLNDIDNLTQEKVTHSTELINESTQPNTEFYWNTVNKLSLSEVKELLGEVDVEKKVMELYNNFKLKPFEAMYPLEGATKRFVENVYNQALEDNKEKKYTEEDMLEAYKMGLMKLSDQRLKDYMLPKTEWEVEMVDGKLKLKS